MKLSVVIATFNRRAVLEECIKSLLQNTERSFEIIVVDSTSTDGTPKLKDIYPIRYISIPERNRQKARNLGISVAKGKIIAFIDDDVVVTKDWAKNILEPYKNPKVGGVGGRVIPYGKSFHYHVPTKKSEIGKVRRDGLILGNFDVPVSDYLEVDHLPGCNMSFRRELLIKIGGFDENIKGNCFRDDTDVSVRIKKLNYKLIYNSKAVVYHRYLGKKVDENWIYWYIRNSIYFYFKNIFFPFKIFFIPFLFRLFLIPKYYVKKSGIILKWNPLIPYKAIKGVIDGIFMLKLLRDHRIAFEDRK